MSEEIIKLNDYKVVVGRGTFSSLPARIAKYKGSKIIVITDEKVESIYGQKLRELLDGHDVSVHVVAPGESSKSFQVYEGLAEKIIRNGIHRDDLIIAFGGGVIGDLAGFLAATLLRGVDYIGIPTTLLAMVDASVGSKNAINTKYGKNLIGTFYDPVLVLVDLNFLETLTMDEYNNGLAEAIKIAFIAEPSLYEKIKKGKNLSVADVVTCIKLKAEYVKEDFKDYGKRKLLNFGHTFGHAIEKVNNFNIKHGIAISYGMLMALSLSAKLGLCDIALYEDLKSVLLSRNLVVEPLLEVKDYVGYLFWDKKFTREGLDFVAIRRIGKAELIKIQRVDFL